MSPFDSVEKNPLLKIEEDRIHFFAFGPFSRAQNLTYDQAQRITRFLDFYLIWSLIGLILWQYLFGFHWTSSFILVAFALYWLRVQIFARNTSFSEVSANLEEISLKLVEPQTIPSLMLVNLAILGFLFWGVHEVITDWPMPLPFIISDGVVLILCLLLFTYSTLLLYLKGQSLQNF